MMLTSHIGGLSMDDSTVTIEVENGWVYVEDNGIVIARYRAED
jgi:hypothetical protein